MDTADENRSTPGLWWVVLGLSLVFVIGASAALWHLRRATIDYEARELGLLSRALTDALDRGLQQVETGLRVTRSDLRDGRLQLSDSDLQRRLRTRADLMPLVRTIWLVSGDGQPLFSSDDSSIPDLSSFSPALNELADNATAISRPFPGKKDGQAMVALAVREADAPGVAGGWILAGLPAEALRGSFSVASPAPDARMQIVRDDGVRLAGAILSSPPVRDEATRARLLADMPEMELRRFRDGSERLVARQHLPRFGIRLVMTRDLDAVLSNWREAARLTAAAVAVMLAVLVVSVHLLLRAYRKSAEAQRALELELARSGKLRSLGTLAGGVAHDFNNVLAAVIGYGEMAQDTASPGGDQARHLGRLMQAALRGRSLVERILAFSRGGARASVIFELEPVVEEVLGLLSASLPGGIVLERRFEAPGARLRGDPTRALEAVMNLCTNAIHAMPRGGSVVLEIRRVHEGAGRVLSHGQMGPGRYVAMSVSDQGTGITPQVMERLFEPFFTTRTHESGIGLGLAVVHAVVTEFGGAIDVRSEARRGTRFTLYFPEFTEEKGVSLPAPALTPKGAGQTLLVVDDEPDLVTLMVETLTGLGYAPEGYSDPAAALQALREHPERFAAVITDEVMPGLRGTQLTEALRPHAPHIPVFLVSGYGGELLAARAAAAGVTQVLAKPLQRDELARALSAVLA